MESQVPDPSSKVLDGNIGFFWPQEAQGTADLSDALLIRGYIHQTADSLVEVRALDEHRSVRGMFGMGARARAVALFGAAEETGLLVPEVLGTGVNAQFGGSKASILRYRARALITGVEVRAAKSSRVQSASLTFQEGLSFAELTAIHESHKVDPESNLVTEATFTLRANSSPLNGGTHGSFNVNLAPDWATSGTSTKRTLSSGLTIGLSVARPRPFSDFRPLLLGLQDLLNLAYDRFVPADGGRAVVHGCQDHGHSYLWMEEVMVQPPHIARASTAKESVPLFTLADLGGPEGFRRWLSLRDRFPDVTVVVASGYRVGGGRQPSRLLEVAAAIEYYVNANRKAGATWAKKVSAPSHAEALARHVGKPFESLVGDHSVWAKTFLTTYNGVKHDPAFQRDPEVLQLLSWSGQVLLLGALLDRSARTKAPSRKILSDRRLEGGGERLRAILKT
ncbi:hypothetical protein [Intrasporangium flavum]|uniref:ApeA N-terminal domain 1-containing protein n=1 Tax=Intrasporangium flavum TaxID=1428657 RepID=UPI001A95F8F0|nr:hypothetical protein [Intrasporangium flavum]